MKHLFYITILLLGYKAFPQTGISTPIDAHFIEYHPPRTPAIFVERSKQNPIFSIYFAVSISIDTAGFVNGMVINPIFGLGNKFSVTDSVWKICESNILEVSNRWRFKPILWEDLGLGGQEVMDHMNQDPLLRPYGGIQSHLVIFRFSNAAIDNEYNKHYMLNAHP